MDTNTQNKGLVPIEQSQAVSLMPSEGVWKRMNDQAQMLVQSGFLPPHLNKKEKALAVMLKGYELGLPTMQALSQLYVVGQKIGMQGEGMLALIRSRCPDARIDFEELSAKQCKIVAERPGSKATTFTFTMEDAKQMQLIGKPGGNYAKQPAVMLQWRCVAKMARAMFSDVLMGAKYTPDELGARLDEKGEPIDVKSEVVETKTAALNKTFGSDSAVGEVEQKTETPGPSPEQQQKADEEKHAIERGQLTKQIVDAQKRMNLDKDGLVQYVYDLFQKKTVQLTNEEMQQLINRMNSDIAGK